MNGPNGNGNSDPNIGLFRGQVILHESVHSIGIDDDFFLSQADYLLEWAKGQGVQGVENITIDRDNGSRTLNNFINVFCN